MSEIGLVYGYEDASVDYYRLTEKVASHLEWDMVRSAVPGLIHDELTGGVRPTAVICALGAEALAFQETTVAPIIALADELDIPRAIIANERSARRFTRPNSSDIFIPRTNDLRGMLEPVVSWLEALPIG